MGTISISTPDGRVGEPERWLPFLSRELRKPDGFVVVEDGRNSYVQARNTAGTLVIEYRDGSALRHFQAAVLDSTTSPTCLRSGCGASASSSSATNGSG